jgi:spore coat protein A
LARIARRDHGWVSGAGFTFAGPLPTERESTTVKRRDLFKAGAVTGAALLLPAERLIANAVGSEATVTAFSVPMPIPTVLQPVARSMTTDYYQMTQREADVEIIPGTKTRVRTFNGSFPGPTINAIKGRRVIVTQTNGFTDPVVTHLHGGHVAPQDDGHVLDAIAPGASRQYTYPNNQNGATLWYHDHAHHLESEHVYRGQSGFYIVHDPATFPLALPWGANDVPIMLRSVHLDDNAQLVYTPNDFRGRNTILVNGKPQPYFKVAARKYRFRFLNSANDSAYKLALADGSQIVHVASDGGLLPAPVVTDNVDIFPGERVEAVIDFSRYPVGTSVVLINQYGETDQTRQVMRFDVDRTATDDSRIPTADDLPDLPAPGAPVVTRDVTLNIDPQTFLFLLNGKPFDPDRVDFKVKQGDQEVWRITNLDTTFGIPHNLHLHLVQFQVLDRNGVPVGPTEQGWKDTVKVWPGETVRIAVKFATQFTGRYLFHCHLLDHSAAAMMAQYEITP